MVVNLENILLAMLLARLRTERAVARLRYFRAEDALAWRSNGSMFRIGVERCLNFLTSISQSEIGERPELLASSVNNEVKLVINHLREIPRLDLDRFYHDDLLLWEVLDRRAASDLTLRAMDVAAAVGDIVDAVDIAAETVEFGPSQRSIGRYKVYQHYRFETWGDETNSLRNKLHHEGLQLLRELNFSNRDARLHKTLQTMLIELKGGEDIVRLGVTNRHLSEIARVYRDELPERVLASLAVLTDQTVSILSMSAQWRKFLEQAALIGSSQDSIKQGGRADSTGLVSWRSSIPSVLDGFDIDFSPYLPDLGSSAITSITRPAPPPDQLESVQATIAANIADGAPLDEAARQLTLHRLDDDVQKALTVWTLHNFKDRYDLEILNDQFASFLKVVRTSKAGGTSYVALAEMAMIHEEAEKPKTAVSFYLSAAREAYALKNFAAAKAIAAKITTLAQGGLHAHD